MANGFYAPTRAEEPKCPGVEFIVLENIEDVTAKVNAAIKPGMSTADAGKAQREAMGSLEKECSTNGMRCDVVTLYSGAMYNLYKYKKYDDVRLVFAPEFPIAFFGGDPDNFEYPRYDLDISFFRAYENGEPVKVQDYLKWSPVGTAKVIWYSCPAIPAAPAACSRWINLLSCATTSSRCSSQSYTRRIDVPSQKFSAQSPENEREAQSDVFGLQNSFKAVTGYEARPERQRADGQESCG